MDTINPSNKRYAHMFSYLKYKGYTEEEAKLLTEYLESIVVPIFDKYCNRLYIK